MALADRSTLSGEAGVLIQTALTAAPQNPKALWYGGLSAVARGQTELAAERWRRLLNQGLPEQQRQVVQQQLASLGGSIAAAPDPCGSAQAGSAVTITIEISVAEHLRAWIDGGAPLFVVARDPDRPGPPVAVVRQTAGALPATVRITDANLMLPGGSLADQPRLRLIARVSNGGDAIAKPGDIYGETTWDRDQQPGDPAVIVIDSLVE